MKIFKKVEVTGKNWIFGNNELVLRPVEKIQELYLKELKVNLENFKELGEGNVGVLKITVTIINIGSSFLCEVFLVNFDGDVVVVHNPKNSFQKDI